MKIKEKYLDKLLVEGNDDQHVIWSLCQHHSLPESFDVIDCGSIESVLKRFELSINENASSIHTIGLVIDADADLNNRWAQIKSKINHCGGYEIMNDLPAGGLIIHSNEPYKPVIGVWIMPNNNVNGMLEDFVACLASENDPVMTFVENCLENLENDKKNLYKPIHRAKAKIHTYLSWQEDPGTPMGLAITKRYLNPNSPNCEVFVDWLKKLFVS